MQGMHVNQISLSRRWRCLLAFDCLEDRFLPSVVGPLAPEPGSQFDTHPEVQRNAAMEATAPESAAGYLPTENWDTLPQSNALPEIGHADEHPTDVAEDIAEVLSWFHDGQFWSNAFADDDWQEDLQVFFAAFPDYGLPTLELDLPVIRSEEDESALNFAAKLPPAGTRIFDKFDTDAPKTKIAFKPAPVPVKQQDIGKQGTQTVPAIETLKQQASERSFQAVIPAVEVPADSRKPEQSDAPDGLVQDAAFVDLTEFEEAMGRFLEHLEHGIDRLVVLLESKPLAPWIASALLSAAAIELTRRQLRHQAKSQDDVELTVRSHGLRHRPANGRA